MRIISKEPDFYDYGMAYGIDPNVVYVREPMKIDNRVLHRSHTSDMCVVVHGGKRYVKEDRRELDEVIFVVAGKVRRLYYLEVDGKLDVSDDPSKWGTPHERLIHVKVSDQKLIDLSTELKAPVLICGVYIDFAKRCSRKQANYEKSRFIVNEDVQTGTLAKVGPGCETYINAPILGRLGYSNFFGVTPEETFMEIQNWLMSVEDKPMVEIGNKERIAKAGFDLKTSFRGK